MIFFLFFYLSRIFVVPRIRDSCLVVVVLSYVLPRPYMNEARLVSWLIGFVLFIPDLL